MLLPARKHISATLALAIVVCVAGDRSLAAENSNRALFENRAVQGELNLSAEQQAKVDAIVAEAEDQIAVQLKAAAEKVGDKEKLAELESQIADDVMEKQGDRFMDLLDNKQKVRFWQIGMQAQGREVAFHNNRVRRLLKMTDKQIEQLDKIAGETRAEIVKLATDPALSIDTIKYRVELAKKNCLDSELGVLTDEQRKKFEEILGKPFDLDRLARADGTKPRALTFIFPMRGGNAYFLLSSAQTRKTLGISPEQAEKIDEILMRADHDLTAVRLGVLQKNEQDFPALSLGEKRRTVKAILDGVRPINQETTRQIRAVLTAEQAAQLDEQAMRVLGARAIEADSIAKRLKLSDKQKSAFAKLTAEFDETTAPLAVVRRSADLDKAYDAALEKYKTAVRAILTDQQRQALGDQEGDR